MKRTDPCEGRDQSGLPAPTTHFWKQQLEKALSEAQGGKAICADMPRNRDPVNVASHLNMEFGVVFYEPRQLHSLPVTWCCIYLSYRVTLALVYNCLVCCCCPGCFFSCWWGIFRGFFNYVMSWIVYPAIRLQEIIVLSVEPFISLLHRCCCAPFDDCCELLFSGVKVQTLLLPRYASDGVLVV